MKISFPTNTKQLITEMIDTIGREVIFYTISSYPCTASTCYLDPVNNTSTNSFCPVCSGKFWIAAYSGTMRKAHVTWKFADLKQWETGGWNFVGDGIIKVMYSGNIMDIIDSTDYILVDDKKVNIDKITVLGVPSLNRIIIDFKEREK